jgi:hypothetical protein
MQGSQVPALNPPLTFQQHTETAVTQIKPSGHCDGYTMGAFEKS